MTAVFNRLGPYEILDEIGRGGMAQVFLAKDTRSDRTVALKVVPPGRDHEARLILEAEESGAELQRQFSEVSPQVPAVYEHRRDESGYFLVAMEYLDGENLSDLIARGPVQAERAVNIALELCACLELAHHFQPLRGERPMRLVHGDLKPRNVRITSAGSVKVLDFGIAKALSLSRKVTRNDFGTMPYLSPERLETVEVDEFADLWAVGVMLYEMLRGTPPYQAPDTQRLERLIRSRVPPLPLTGKSPAALEAVVTRMLGPRPAMRYANAHAVREDLERFKSGKTTTAEELGWPNNFADEAPTRRTEPPTTARRSGASDSVDSEPTRRTKPSAAPYTAGPKGPVLRTAAGDARTVSPRSRNVVIRARRRAVALLVMLSFVSFGLFANELSVATEARRVSADVSTRELDQLDGAWQSHDALARRSYLRFGTLSLERALTQRTLSLTDRIVGSYRMGLPSVREAQWQSARDALARALRGSDGNRYVRAAYRYCDGHLHRINGEAHLRRHEDADAQRELTEAVASFREAADLRSDWPDPFLGLARTFIYGLEDIDRGADALNQAQRRGYTPTERETVQLADGYRARGNSLVRNAKQLEGMSQESDYLTRAVEAYSRALTLYSQALSVANVPMSIRATQRAHDQTQQRLDDLSHGAAEPVTEPDEPSDHADPAPPADQTTGLPSDGADSWL